MESIIRLGFLGCLIAGIVMCRNAWNYATQPQYETYSAPHVVPQYADTDGDGFVPAQGDPLYDEHYANNVNVPNSDALQGLANINQIVADANYTQAEAEKVEAETEQIRQDTKMTLWGTRIILIIALSVVLLIVFMLTK